MADVSEYFERIIRDVIWRAIHDALNFIGTEIEEAINKKLAELTKPEAMDKALASSPVVVRIVAIVPDKSFTLLVRGKIPISDGLDAFTRVEVEVSSKVHIVSSGPTAQILKWNSIAADLKLGENPITNAILAVGYVDGNWSGRGKLQFITGGFGLDLFLGGLSDRGAMVGIGVNKLPTPIPLGATGLGLRAVHGEFAYNFKPRLISRKGPNIGRETNNPTAMDYADWARDDAVDRWKPAAPSETAIGVGIGCGVVTLLDNGALLALDPVGLTVLAPGLVFVVGGEGRLLNSPGIRAAGYLAVDVPSGSIAVGIDVAAKMTSDDGALFDAAGIFDAFFSLTNPSAWYLHLGTNEKPIRAEVFKGILKGQIYLMIDNNSLAFGIAVSIGGEYKLWIIKIIARLGAGVAAKIGWSPFQLEGQFAIFVQFGIAIWKLKFILTGSLSVTGATPHPQYIKGTIKLTLSLPWPIPDIPLYSTYDRSEKVLTPPTIETPLMTGVLT